MKIINRVTDEDYIQWIRHFVVNVINHNDIEYTEVIIDDVEFSERIFIIIDGEEYDIRTWDFHPIGRDKNGEVCAEAVRYTLFKMIWGENGNGHGEEVCNGTEAICWDNELIKC